MPRKNATLELPSPTEMVLVSPDSPESLPPVSIEDGQETVVSTGKVHMKKELGLLEGCAIILGIILGSGNHQRNSAGYFDK
jgi:hypothetical protein